MSSNIKLYGIIGILIAFLALGATTFYYYSQFKSTEIDLTNANSKLTALEKELSDEKDNNKVLTSEIEAGIKKLALVDSLYRSADQARTEQLEKNKVLQNKIATITTKLPKPIPRAETSKETAQEVINSQLRIKLIWEVFCVNNPDLDECFGLVDPAPIQPNTNQPSASPTMDTTVTSVERSPMEAGHDD